MSIEQRSSSAPLGSGAMLAAMIGACAVCCAAPLLAVGVGGIVLTLARPSVWIVAIAGVGTLTTWAWMRRRSRRSTLFAGPMTQQLVCRLPSGDRPQRARDLRALFGAAFIGRGRSASGVSWELRALPGIKEESVRLAALETQCCSGVRFDVAAHGEQIVWHISGPPSASAVLDALYELPVLIRTQDDDRVWGLLDGSACGPAGRTI